MWYLIWGVGMASLVVVSVWRASLAEANGFFEN